MGIEHLRGGSNRLLHNRLTRKHIDDGVGHEEHLVGTSKRVFVLATNRVELEQGIEGHELDACPFVEFLARHTFRKVSFHRPIRMRVTITVRQTNQLAILSEESHIAAPSIHTNTGKRNSLCLNLLQSKKDFFVEVRKVPENVSVAMNLRGFEARQFAHLNSLAIVFGDNRTATRGT